MTFLRLENAAALLENKIKNKHSGVTALTLETVCVKVTNVCLSCHFEDHPSSCSFSLCLFQHGHLFCYCLSKPCINRTSVSGRSFSDLALKY